MSGPADTWAVLPVKPFAEAKSRLASVMGSEERERFARAMLHHVLDVLGQVAAIERVLITTTCPQVEAVGRRYGAEVIPDPPTERLADVVDHALAATRARQALVLMADLPTVTHDDVHAVLAPLSQGKRVVVAPDRHQMGTNALALRPPDAMPTCFGHSDSFQRHLAAADALGAPALVVRAVGLGLDIDTPGDFGLFLQREPLMRL